MSRILLIDDEPATRLVTHNRLKDLGHEVVAADSGAKGLLDARESTFDLILAAVELSAGVGGLEVCRRLKQLPQTQKIPLLLYSKVGTGREEAHKAFEAGCDAFLAKADLALLDHVVRSLLRTKAHHDELARQIRALEDHNRRLAAEQQHGADLELSTHGGEHALVHRDLAAARPDGALLVDAEGQTRLFDRGARDLLGTAIETRTLGRIAPASGLEAFVRDARTEAREGFRFELPARSGRSGRALSASVVPLVPPPGTVDPGLRLVLLLDTSKRRVAAELMRLQETPLPRREVGVLRDAGRLAFGPGTLVGDSPAMSAVRARISAAAGGSSPVLITGEPGSGRELAARALHFGGDAAGPFLPLSCAALGEQSLESELFGHVKNAFPDALADRPGLLQQGAQGTVYLAEVEALPLALQERLARALREGHAPRVGGERPEPVEARVVASSSEDLQALAERGDFSRELLELLAKTWIHLPPLRERPEDVADLARVFLQRHGSARPGLELRDEALHVLESHDWPENLRELEACVQGAIQRSSGDTIEVEHLPPALRELHATLQPRELIPAAPPVRVGGQRNAVAEPPRTLAASRQQAERKPWEILPEDPVSLDLYEKKALLRALEETGGDRLAAARLLNVGKSTLYRKLKRYGIA